MKYVAPVAEMFSVEAASVLLVSGNTQPPRPNCPNELPQEEI